MGAQSTVLSGYLDVMVVMTSLLWTSLVQRASRWILVTGNSSATALASISPGSEEDGFN